MTRITRLVVVAALGAAAFFNGVASAQVATAPTVPVTPAPPEAEPGAPAAPQPPPDVWLARPVAEVQALDKITARVTPLTVRVGQSVTFGSLSIYVRACLVRPPEQAADAAMFLDITDQHEGAPQFHGWMVMSAPGIAMLEHPVYDIRPTACHA